MSKNKWVQEQILIEQNMNRTEQWQYNGQFNSDKYPFTTSRFARAALRAKSNYSDCARFGQRRDSVQVP